MHVNRLACLVLGVGMTCHLFLSESSGAETTPPSIPPIQLATNPFSPTMCKLTPHGPEIRIRVAGRSPIVIRRVPGQFVPSDPQRARQKDYVHFVSLSSLTNGALQEGAVAFTIEHAVIFTEAHPRGIARPKFVDAFPPDKRRLAERALDTFLRLHCIFNAAVDACRPYPPGATYATDDYILRINTGKHRFRSLALAFNADPTPRRPLYQPTTGKAGGFVDPDANHQTNVSYHALNPLNFYRPISAPYTPK